VSAWVFFWLRGSNSWLLLLLKSLLSSAMATFSSSSISCLKLSRFALAAFETVMAA
jgi:hypothetical protein